MIEIIPNWHPILVHFTIGLLGTAVLFYFASAIVPITHRWYEQWLNVANWCLWAGCFFAIATATAGWFAFNSVAHDEPSHAAMTIHRNWALTTAAIFLLLGTEAILAARRQRKPGFLFLSSSAIAAGMLMITGWLGAEAVFRYGLGVMSLPSIEADSAGHQGNHGSKNNPSIESHRSTVNIKPERPMVNVDRRNAGGGEHQERSTILLTKPHAHGHGH